MRILLFILITTSLYAQSDSSMDKLNFKSLFRNKFEADKPYAAQLNPKAISFVDEYMRKYGKSLEKMKSWGKPYFDLYDQILAIYGIPKEMKYLSVIESRLNAGIISWAGAAGPWQLMDFEAKRLGLRVSFPDERMDYIKSTHAAARIMRERFAEFNDWLLVVAAYNGGAGRVRQAIRKTGTRDFWELQYHLPEETRNHVKKFIATHYVMEGGGGWTTLTAAETKYAKENTPTTITNLSTEDAANTTTIEISGRFHSLIVANELLMDIKQFTLWNPGFDKVLGEGKKYNFRLEKSKLHLFEAKRNQLLAASIRALIEGSLPK
ncbi:MAG: lytic transglycosylase domain-containing protein [Sphingobacteriia bacterium]|nr:MAG: lytic transglycosylase domain-containing protein [Sphingobacteriia bacterium]